MAQTIKIKRSTTAASPGSLSAGELAYSEDSHKLFIGQPSDNAVISIGGKLYIDMLDHTAGTLTASSAIVVDANSKVDKLLTGAIRINNTAGQIDTSAGSLTIDPTANLIIKTGTVDLSTQATEFQIIDNSATSFTISEGSNTYFTINTTNSSEKITFSKPVEFSGGLETSNYTLPSADGNAGQAIITNGSGVTSFSNVVTSLGLATSSETSTTSSVDMLGNENLSIESGEGINVALSGQAFTISAEEATTSNKGVASFNATDFGVTNGVVTVAATTLGSSALNPGETTTALAGLTQLDVDNVRIDGNTISSTDSNGHITLSPEGTGTVKVPSGYKDRAGFTSESLVTKEYVDALKQALDIKDSARLATTANLGATYNNSDGTLTNSGNNAALAIDDVTTVAGNRILVKNQTAGEQNGIYSVTTVGDGSTAWVLTRATDANVAAEITGGTFVFVEEGTVGGDNGYVFTHNGTPTLGTTDLTVSQFSGAGQIADGNGLSKTGNALSVTVDNVGIINTGGGGSAVAIKGITATAAGDLLLGVASNGGYSRLVKPASTATAYSYILSMDTSGNARWADTIDGGTFS